jgi:hypothetical protein
MNFCAQKYGKYISTTQTEEIHPLMFDLEDEVLTPTGISPYQPENISPVTST